MAPAGQRHQRRVGQRHQTGSDLPANTVEFVEGIGIRRLSGIRIPRDAEIVRVSLGAPPSPGRKVIVTEWKLFGWPERSGVTIEEMLVE